LEEEPKFRERESSILLLILSILPNLSSPNCKQHLKEGFYFRLLMMQTNRLSIQDLASPDREKNLSPYEACELNIHLNSYYFQLRGALDNLAWSLNYEFDLLPDATEDSPRERGSCYLFHPRFIEALRESNPHLVETIERKVKWERQFKEHRDPVAHRIPLFAVPGIVNEQQAEDVRKKRGLAAQSLKDGDLDSCMNCLIQAAAVGKYQPVFTLSLIHISEPTRPY